MVPEFLILDTAAHYQQLKGLALTYAEQSPEQYPACTSEFFVTDLAAEVVENIRDLRYAERNLKNLAGEIQAGVIAGGNYIPPVFARPVYALGQEVVRQLLDVRAYMPDSVLPYHLYLLPNPKANVTMVLQRTNELPR